MEIIAEVKFAHISPKKVKPLLGDLRRRPVMEVLTGLRYAQSKAGQLIYKLIASATANALNNYNLKSDNLKIKLLTADDGVRYKRYWLRSHGAADVRLKRTTHLRVVLEEITPITIDKKSVKAAPAPGHAVSPVLSVSTGSAVSAAPA